MVIDLIRGLGFCILQIWDSVFSGVLGTAQPRIGTAHRKRERERERASKQARASSILYATIDTRC